MALTVLSVAYPLAPVGEDSAGGAEQVLALLDLALTQRGPQSIVVASDGSSVTGTLVKTPGVKGVLDAGARAFVWEEHRKAIARALQGWHIDLVHMHGVDFYRYLPPPGIPVLVTLHLPPGWYPPQVFHLDRPRTYLHCVSAAQERTCPPDAKLLPPIGNGVPVEHLRMSAHKRGWAMTLGRICPEKGFHIALDAAKAAHVPLLLAGEVYRYPEHEHYYRKEIVPRLDAKRCFIGGIGFERKRRLLSAARCLLVPSLAPETSSLVAMEALACGTPVVAFPAGALTEIVEDGKTGFIVHDEKEMGDAIHAAAGLNPEACRRAARERFSADRMVAQYLDLYEALCSGEPSISRACHPTVEPLHAA